MYSLGCIISSGKRIQNRQYDEGKGTLTVQEAGRKGGMRTAQTHGKEFYEEIGRKEGQRALIQGFLDCGEMKKW